jgi:hypothetical protein
MRDAAEIQDDIIAYEREGESLAARFGVVPPWVNEMIDRLEEELSEAVADSLRPWPKEQTGVA